MYGPTTLVTLGFAAIASALPTTSPAGGPLVERGAIADRYKFYTGNGNVKSWPNQDMWGSWDALWNTNANVMKNSCGWNGWGANNSPKEISDIKWAIDKISGETGVDKRFILVIIMQESKGCVRAPTTTSPDGRVTNPGLMQSHNGSGRCAGVNPCPDSSIYRMIKDGSNGTSSGDGLKQTLAKAAAHVGGKGGQAYYAAARMYNSGSVDWNNLNNGLGATNCYASDVANRFTGWTLAASGCRA